MSEYNFSPKSILLANALGCLVVVLVLAGIIALILNLVLP